MFLDQAPSDTALLSATGGVTARTHAAHVHTQEGKAMSAPATRCDYCRKPFTADNPGVPVHAWEDDKYTLEDTLCATTHEECWWLMVKGNSRIRIIKSA